MFFGTQCTSSDCVTLYIHLAGAVGRWHCALNCGWLRNIISVRPQAWKEYTQRHNTHRASWTGCAEGMAKQRTGILVTRRLWRRTFRSSGRGFEKTANWQVHTRPWGRCDTQPSQTIANYRLITKMKHFRWRNVFDNMCTCVEWAVDHFGLGLTSIHQLLRKIFAKNVIYMWTHLRKALTRCNVAVRLVLLASTVRLNANTTLTSEIFIAWRVLWKGAGELSGWYL